MKRKILCSLLAVLVVMSAFPLYSFADEGKDGNEDEYNWSLDGFESFTSGLDYLAANNVFGNVDISSFMPNGNTSWQTAISEAESMQSIVSGGLPAEFSEVWHSFSGATVTDLPSVNLQYTNLQNELNLMGWGKEYGLEIEPFSPGYSNNVLTQFKDTFSGFSGTLDMNLPEVPESFTVENMLNSAKAGRDSAVGDFYNSNAYKSVIHDSGYSNLLNEASKVKSMPSLLSIDALSEAQAAGDNWAKGKQEANKVSLDAFGKDYSGSSDATVPGSKAWQNDQKVKSLYNEHKSKIESGLRANSNNAAVQNSKDDSELSSMIASLIEEADQGVNDTETKMETQKTDQNNFIAGAIAGVIDTTAGNGYVGPIGKTITQFGSFLYNKASDWFLGDSRDSSGYEEVAMGIQEYYFGDKL